MIESHVQQSAAFEWGIRAEGKRTLWRVPLVSWVNEGR